MKKLILIIGAFALLTVLVLTPGCASKEVTTTTNADGTQTSVTNLVPNHVAATVASVASSITPFIPQPFGAAIGAELTLLTVISGAIAAAQRRRANDHANMLQTVITGVESANNQATKDAIHTIATAAGVQDKLDPIVQDITALLPQKPAGT